MSRLDKYVARRHEIAQRYDQILVGLPVITPWQHPDTYSGLHLYVVQLDQRRSEKSHLAVFEKLREQGVGVNLHYIPVHTQPYYQKMGFRAGQFPAAEAYYAQAISLPMYPTMTEAQQDAVVDALHENRGNSGSWW
jgi:dTDP-4-amino-4,6-dideoxygalactose transaminase